MAFQLASEIILNIGQLSQELLKSAQDFLPHSAWNTRNLLELWIWPKYCCAARENAWRFHEDCLRDSQGLTNSYVKMCELIGHSREMESELRARLATVARAKLGLDSIDAEYKRVAEAARTVGLQEWFVAYNQFLSKFVHPTAFFVVGMSAQPEQWRDMQVVFITMGCTFARECTTILEQTILNVPKV